MGTHSQRGLSKCLPGYKVLILGRKEAGSRYRWPIQASSRLPSSSDNSASPPGSFRRTQGFPAGHEKVGEPATVTRPALPPRKGDARLHKHAYTRRHRFCEAEGGGLRERPQKGKVRCSQPLRGHSATEDVGDSLKPCLLAMGSPTPDLGDGTSQLHSSPMHRS